MPCLLIIHCLWYLDSHILLGNGLNKMLRGLVVTHLLILNMKQFVNISNFLKCITIYGMIFSAAHWSA